MNSKYKIVIVISSLLVILSLSITTISYFVSLNNTQKQLRTQSLPLSLDNIYTAMQKRIIEPYLVSSMMANDTFVQNWILEKEVNTKKIKQYLDAVKNKYGMLTSFLVSEKSGNYYNQNGFIEKVRKDNLNNKWYFRFKNIQSKHEINLDFNDNISNSMIMFINYKIIDSKFNYLGVTGVGFKISYIDDMLKMFRLKHHFKVYFIDERGKIILSEKNIIPEKSLDEMPYLKDFKEQLVSKETSYIEFKKNGHIHLLNTKYIPELNLYLLVEVNLDDFTKDIRYIFFVNLFIALLISLLVVIITIYLIKNYNRKLEYLAGRDQLTGINNRRVFEQKFSNQIELNRREAREISLFFMDVDNFKAINDKFGHAVGDKALIRIAKILEENTRKNDIIARWGGEEFVCAYINSSKENAIHTTQRIREKMKNDCILKDLVHSEITGSFGLTQLRVDDDLDSIITRADNLMYKSKDAGKNRLIIDEDI